MLTAVYLINSIPTVKLKGRSPHEILFGEKVHTDHIRIFDCQCYAHHVPKSKDKFAFCSGGVSLWNMHIVRRHENSMILIGESSFILAMSLFTKIFFLSSKMIIRARLGMLYVLLREMLIWSLVRVVRMKPNQST